MAFTISRANKIASALVDLVEPDSWNVNGGTGVLSIDDGLLIIRQPPFVHGQVKALLAALHKVPNGAGHSVDPPSADIIAQNQAIQASLSHVLPTISLGQTTLQDRSVRSGSKAMLSKTPKCRVVIALSLSR